MLGLQFIPTYDAAFDPAAAADSAFFVLSGGIYESRVGKRIEPYFKVTVENPGVSGWMPTANRYAILWEKRAEDTQPILLARGRLVPLPTGMAGSTIELTFRCLPPNADDILKAAANFLRTGEAVDYDPDSPLADRLDAEYYDPVFYGAGAEDDPETALSARPEVWHWDRRTLTVSRTHLVDSAITHDVGYEGIGEPPSLSISQPPRPISKVRVTAAWTQVAKGKQSVANNDSVETFTFEDFLNSFPKPGTAIGANTGWTLDEAKINSVSDGSSSWLTVSGSKFGAASGGKLQVRPKLIDFTLRAAYDYQQQRQEILTISMPSGLQDLPAEDDEVEVVETLNLSSLNIDSSTAEWIYEDETTLEPKTYAIGDEVLANGKAWTCLVAHTATENFTPRDPATDVQLWQIREKRAPMRDSASSRYFDSARGIRSVRHAILRLARTNLERSQCGEVTFDIPWLLGREMTCADSVRIAHRRLPGGELVGKVVGLELLIEEGGKRSARVTLASIPGTNAAVPTPGAGQSQTGSVVYSTSYAGVRTPVNAAALSVAAPRVYAFENVWSEQLLAASGQPDPIAVIGSMPTRLKIAFTPLREEDILTRRMSVTCEPLALPRQINLRPDMGGA
ncbi:carbohydrate-binding protein [Gellertiella hungarica]|uniref:Chitin-binding type-3 domain-containing protein n=1 Tax=Gellertiella hungarica TaxID=1572859 RepID=A0A7W6NK90_9HYPH|nr:carbohydrate-binding protein [Gellertiella hungarica]MBB4064057.1 hypothetical protein [Gellertiella hungarica]